MQVSDLEAVAAVYRYRSFSEAAYVMDYSVSAISKKIAKVEAELGLTLFVRKTKSSHLTVTEEGEAVMPAVQAIVDGYSDLSYIVENLSGEQSNQLSLGYTPLVGTIGESDILTAYMERCPEVDVELVPGTMPDLMNSLRSGKIDGAFLLMFNLTASSMPMFETLARDDYQFVQIMRNRKLYIGLSGNHPLAGRKTITLNEIAEETFLFSNYQKQSRYESRISELKKLIDGEEHPLKTRFVDFFNKDVALHLVESGTCVLPQVVKPRSGGYNIVFAEVENYPDEAVGLFVCRRNNHSKAMRSLVKCAKEYSVREGLSSDAAERTGTD